MIRLGEALHKIAQSFGWQGTIQDENIMSSRHPWRGFINASDEKPAINKEILKRVWQYAKPYLGGILGSLGAILITTLLNLINPLIMRQLVDVVLPIKMRTS